MLDDDPFSDDFLADPYPRHERIRDAGPVVRLSRYGIWASARHEQVFAALTDWRTFSSASGVGLADFRKEKPWRVPSLLLEADPPGHTQVREVMAQVLSPRRVRGLRERFAPVADELVSDLVERGSFDAVRDLAEVFPLRVFPDAVGLPEEGREHLLRYGDMAFNGFGPRNDLFGRAMADAEQVQAWITAACRRENLAAGGLGRDIWAFADTGTITQEQAAMLVRSLLSAGVDTTVYAIGNALAALTAHPGQWARLHDDPTLAKHAFEEAIRYESPVQTFFRTTTRTTDLGGVWIGPGEKILLFLGAANRDPRKWENPHTLEITRRAAGHVGFGMGVHGCVGQQIARLEGDVVLSALAERAATLTPTAAPVLRPNNTLRGFSSAPIQVDKATVRRR
ncbi:cytochrome P450 [Planotetraspora thailandica]|uniref:cytochrome P450 n=1 Tax=Planotetraspora thailandica TaxID=487172 RepID=UPI001EF1BABE|nr:cytochrome P450 [Planotetraspora thailandica]